MNPEIERALKDGWPAAKIIEHLKAQQLPVPPELVAMAVQDSSSAVAQEADASGTNVAPALAAAGIGSGVVYGGYRGARRYVSPEGRGKARLARAVEQSGGVDALLRELANFQQAGRGDMVTLGDLSTPLGEQGADFVATNNEPARAELMQLHRQRQQGAPGRLKADAEQLAGFSSPEYMTELSRQSQSDFGASEYGFEGLRRRNAAINPQGAGELASFLDSPRLAKAWQDAAAVGAQGPLPGADALSFEVLQGFKERLDGLTEAAWRKGDGDLGRRLGAARDELVRILGENVEGYRDVSAQYAGFSKHQEALTAGLEAWKNASIQPEMLQMRLQNMNPAELKAFRQGMLGGYITDIEAAKTNRNLANELLARSEATEAKLELVFGSEKAFNEAVKRYSIESSMSRMGGYTGGSATARRLMAGVADDIGETAAAGVIQSPARPTGVLDRVLGKVPEYLKTREARYLAPYFSTPGALRIEELLRMLPK